MNEVKLRQQFDQFLSSVKNLKGTESFTSTNLNL